MKHLGLIALMISSGSALTLPKSLDNVLNMYYKTYSYDYTSVGADPNPTPLNDHPLPVGTPCHTYYDTCGDSATMCCGIATGGKVLKRNTPQSNAGDLYAPNLAFCNKRCGDDGKQCEPFY